MAHDLIRYHGRYRLGDSECEVLTTCAPGRGGISTAPARRTGRRPASHRRFGRRIRRENAVEASTRCSSLLCVEGAHNALRPFQREPHLPGGRPSAFEDCGVAAAPHDRLISDDDGRARRQRVVNFPRKLRIHRAGATRSSRHRRCGHCSSRSSTGAPRGPEPVSFAGRSCLRAARKHDCQAIRAR